MSTADNKVVLEALNIRKSFGGVQALDDVSLTLTAGDVHCIAGENGCGKSTLIKIISGAEVADSGELVMGGSGRQRVSPAWAIRNGIQVIYQDFSLFPNLSVAENIVITSAVANRQKLFSLRALRQKAQSIVEELELDIDLDALVETLSVADRQLTAICRCLVNDAQVLIMDEPTTALTRTEVRRLFVLVERLRARGVALVFVSHKLEEVFEVSQYVTIMRNGKNVISGPVEDFDVASLAKYMTGGAISSERVTSTPQESEIPALQVRDLSLEGAFRDINLEVLPGEIVGLSGLLGSGRNEIAETIFGVYRPTAGTVAVAGNRVKTGSIRRAARAGIGYVPEDRLTQGLFLDKSISENMVAASLDRFTWGHTPFLKKGAIARVVDDLFRKMRVKAPSAALPARALSGGNAQRVVVAKELATEPRVLVLNGPTVGVDVGSKKQILDILREQAAEGIGIVIISDDVPELVSVCNRVLVIRKGEVAVELSGDDLTVDRVNREVSL